MLLTGCAFGRFFLVPPMALLVPGSFQCFFLVLGEILLVPGSFQWYLARSKNMRQRGSGAARLRAGSQAPRPNKPDLLVLIGSDYLFLVISLFLPHKYCPSVKVFKEKNRFLSGGR